MTKTTSSTSTTGAASGGTTNQQLLAALILFAILTVLVSVIEEEATLLSQKVGLAAGSTRKKGETTTTTTAAEGKKKTLKKSRRQQPSSHTAAARTRDDLFCAWSPEDGQACKNMLSRFVCQAKQPKTAVVGRRVVMLGDSTMGPEWLLGHLNESLMSRSVENMERTCPGRYSCEQFEGRRCRSNDLYGLDFAESWEPADRSQGEGPLIDHPSRQFCTDCRGCLSSVVQCNVTSSSSPSSQSCVGGSRRSAVEGKEEKPIVYGAYLTMEFARDVEMQSTEYKTTQENIILGYLKRRWNTPSMVQDFGKPICVVNTGHHDASLPNITLPVFLENVEWYLRLLLAQCSNVIWLGTTAPRAGDNPIQIQRGRKPFPQTQNQTATWNDGVKRLIRSKFSNGGGGSGENDDDNVVVAHVDVFNASLHHPHNDHIHMKPDWYSSLATLFDFEDLLSNCPH